MSSPSNPRSRQLEELVAEAIASIRYGAVEITIHDGAQRTVDRETERVLFTRFQIAYCIPYPLWSITA